MNKSLLALAVLGAFASSAAQAATSVTIGGVVQANVKSYSVGSSTRVTTNETRIDDDYTSRFWLTGSEDLGGGNSAIFYIENRLNTTDSCSLTACGTGNGLGNGDTWLGLKGSWGQATIGKHSFLSVQGLVTEILTGTNGVTAMPTSMMATYSILNQAGGYLDITRRQNSIKYTSPRMGGFTGTVGVSSSSASTDGTINGSTSYNDGSEVFLQGAYANGPIYAALNYRNNRVEGRVGTDDRQVRFSGSYKLPMGLKLGLQLDRATRQVVGAATDSSRTAWSVPVSYGFGSNTLFASYSKAGDLGGVANTGAKMFTLGWDYALSKRTNVGVFYSKLSNDTAGIYQPFLAGTTLTGSGLAAGESASTFALGVKHTF